MVKSPGQSWHEDQRDTAKPFGDDTSAMKDAHRLSKVYHPLVFFEVNITVGTTNNEFDHQSKSFHSMSSMLIV
jgi:hypothetical protein